MDKNKWEVGRTYSTQEMWALMGIGKSTWDHKRNELLDNFSLYYEYEVEYEGNRTNYVIIKQVGDYEKPLNIRDKRIRDAVYADEIVSVIKEDNLQTAKNVSRIIRSHEPIVAFNHTDGTVYEYTRVRMREMFGNKIIIGGTIGEILEKRWCFLDHEHNCYCEMSQKQIDDFYTLFHTEQKDSVKEEAEYYNDYTIGLITRDEMNQAVSKLGFEVFLRARTAYKAKYGFTPIKVPVYGFYGKDIIFFDDGKKAVA